MSTAPKLFDLDFKNWHQWEPIAMTEINHFKDAGSAINRGPTTDNFLSQNPPDKISSIMTTYNSVGNVYCIAIGHATFRIEMANDSLYYLTKDQVQTVGTSQQNHDVIIDVATVFSKQRTTSAS